MAIPKRIFYVWGANEPKRPEVEFCINSWKANCPEYEIVEINEDSIEHFNFQKEIKNNAWFKTVYDRKMFAYVSDFVRIKTLYENGGIYLDTDVTVIKNFDIFLNEPAFVGLQSDKDISNDIFEPAILGAQKGNLLLKQILDFYNEDIWNLPIYRMPQIFSHFIKKNYVEYINKPKGKQEIIKYNDITIYPERYFIPFRYGETFSGKCIEKDTHTIHWWNASWIKPEITNFLENKHKYYHKSQTIGKTVDNTVQVIPCMENYIPIVFISDNNYIIPTATSINSIIKNKHCKTRYHIIILHDSITEDNIKIFEKFNSKDIKIDIVRPSNADYLLSIKEQKNYISPAVLFKFAIPDILKSYDKILYIDGDSLIMDDLYELYNTNINEYYAGVVKDIHPIVTKENEKIGTKSYFNAGVMLLNIKKIINDGVHEKLNSEEILDMTRKFYFFEQDTYNVIFDSKIKFLHPKYNFIIESWNRYGLNTACEIFELNEKEGKRLYDSATIYHLASPEKPWIYKDGLMRKTWEKYYKSSPFSFMPIGNEVYFKDKSKDKFIEKLFSIKNTNNKRHKCITILGLKIKIKAKKRKQSVKDKINILESKIDNLNNQIFELKELIKGEK